MSSTFLDQKIEFLKGVGPAKAELLNKEIAVFTFRDLLFQFPFRYVDKTKYSLVSEITQDSDSVMLNGTIIKARLVKWKRTQRLIATFKDSSGSIELVWFRGAKWIYSSIQEGKNYSLYGRVSVYKGKKNIAHPEIELIDDNKPISTNLTLDPVYSSTEKLNARGLETKARKRLIKSILSKISEKDIPEIFDEYLTNKLKLCTRLESIKWIHFPKNDEELQAASNRIKFEEIFVMQLMILRSKKKRQIKRQGLIFEQVGEKFNAFYKNKLGFELTNAQKRVVKEIRADLGSGYHMNRLLQGDVGSGKTIVGLMCMLLAIDNGYQACLLAPTEILAYQHFQSITETLSGLKIRTAFLSGSVKGKKRQELLRFLIQGDIDILIGTHAIIEDPVIFKNLALAITDEQHRFGVIQRSKLWNKNPVCSPHILVMTATPIPRTLAMTVYGDLEVSTIDELPPGRKAIKTIHKNESRRPELIQFMHKEIANGRQIYVVFPLIEESEKLDLQNLQEGYDQLLHFFPKPDFQISVVHGRMKAKDKEFEMQRFVKGQSQIMVATTVIEVGVNVSNASIMVIENAERFGLSQLHQLRGRVGRGADQAYCILMTSYKLSVNAKERIKTMCRTNNGFEIAEVDMKLRGHGDIQGTQQSGVNKFKLLNLITDQRIIETARNIAINILTEDPGLALPKHEVLKQTLHSLGEQYKDWASIS